MTASFADSYYFPALLDPRDGAHDRAVAASRALSGRFVTMDSILIEVADALASPRDRPRFLAPFRSRPDKDWPLTDCLSFVVMADLGLTDALTADRHSLQAGSRPVLSDP